MSTASHRTDDKTGLEVEPSVVSDDPAVRELLQGAIDLHVHPAPSPFPRRIGILDAARQAADAGFRAICVKSHHHSMVTDVISVTQAVGSLPIDVFAGVALNNQVGGLNPYAVELALRQGGRLVWFPTIASAKHICVHNEELKFPSSELAIRASEPIGILDDEGNLRPEVSDILDLIRSEDAVLAGGHLDAPQLDVLIRAAHEAGISRILVNHPNFVVGADETICRQWVELGAFVEHSLCMYDDRSTFYHWGIDVLMRYVQAVGVSRTILSSDLGQRNNPLPVESYERIMRLLLDAGMEPESIRLLVARNAAELVGI